MLPPQASSFLLFLVPFLHCSVFNKLIPLVTALLHSGVTIFISKSFYFSPSRLKFNPWGLRAGLRESATFPNVSFLELLINTRLHISHATEVRVWHLERSNGINGINKLNVFHPSFLPYALLWLRNMFLAVVSSSNSCVYVLMGFMLLNMYSMWNWNCLWWIRGKSNTRKKKSGETDKMHGKILNKKRQFIWEKCRQKDSSWVSI